MGRGGGRGGAKHSKNNCAGSVFTKAERDKDKGSEGYGTVVQRLGKDSIKDFDVCSLCLQPCKDPVITPQGILYEREAVLQYILKEKQRIAEETAKFHGGLAKKEAESSKRKHKDMLDAVSQFEESECGILPMKKGKSEEKAQAARFDTMREKDIGKSHKAAGSALGHKSLLEGVNLNRSAKDSCFWIPDLTPEAKPTELKEKPDDKVRCPFTGKPLRLKDLIPVKFTPVDPSKLTGGTKSHERFMCPISKKNLSNSVPCAVLRTTGHVIAADLAEIIKKDMLHPLTGDKLSEKDIIPLQRGGTGFSGGGVELEAKRYAPAMRAF
mmetsp:Transcript_38120/g.93662  ORF Transcript_38120/g.93662 Transcript_38120/m.93662 type:complete len:325 (+) Transcript_38120:149-1123(+)|eukprot:CAMPEP_0206248388 /NCGR_PEP_ID=MMETSP0047_2-20121206/20345_1 /ASSEMBLY_ACC=CAM_ASM_000192 /TAXON_ID=195065 /ORGANISM="Chroomonas mesostigmatica_cf, Strain CCMP1168" /LENGTH=324 /DNA_ID=CAMNT_0053674033 /DNA_START=90 /DNA_END=1064 /DNA_ORIENTATION=-